MRTTIIKENISIDLFKNSLLKWANFYNEVVFLDSNASENKNSKYEAIVAIDAFTSIKTDTFSAFETLQQFQQNCNDWIFGYLTYDLKNSVENLNSKNFDGLEFPDLFFFQPKKLYFIHENFVEIQYLKFCDDEIESDFQEILNFKETEKQNYIKPNLKQRIKKKEYLNKVFQIKNHILKGNIYETNFCMEYFAQNCKINPTKVFQDLNSISKAPFSVFLKHNNHFLLCASPERYLKKDGNTITSQPIKGTSKRFEDVLLDNLSANELKANPKEISENIMIVDLVRNDLSKISDKGSVKVTELCEVYSFKQVHQLISTVQSTVERTTLLTDILKSTFPMGSMTGAPKVSAMLLMENFEETKRGLYSGAVGYISPQNNFDFNVVIRGILYNAEKKYVSFSVGSAITALSEPEKEYEECILKAKAMKKVLEN